MTDDRQTENAASEGTRAADCSAIAFHPHYYFKTKSITSPGDRDKRGRFVKARIVLQACSREKAEFATGYILMKEAFALVKMPNGDVSISGKGAR